jgi:hypothetical protein
MDRAQREMLPAGAALPVAMLRGPGGGGGPGGGATAPVAAAPAPAGGLYPDAASAAAAAARAAGEAAQAAEAARRMAAAAGGAAPSAPPPGAGYGGGSGGGGGGGGGGGAWAPAGVLPGPSAPAAPGFKQQTPDEIQRAYDAAQGPPAKGYAEPPNALYPPNPVAGAPPGGAGAGAGAGGGGGGGGDLPSVPPVGGAATATGDELDDLHKRLEALKRSG